MGIRCLLRCKYESHPGRSTARGGGTADRRDHDRASDGRGGTRCDGRADSAARRGAALETAQARVAEMAVLEAKAKADLEKAQTDVARKGL